jgi:hypothetical protein
MFHATIVFVVLRINKVVLKKIPGVSRFFTPVQTGSGAHRVSFVAVKQSGRGVKHPSAP